MSTKRVIEIASDEAGQIIRAADIMADRARQAIRERGRFTVALSGGSTVRPIYERFAAADDVDWRLVYVFWGDDRFVDLTNPYSNYRLARESLIDRVPIPNENIFPIPISARTPANGAKDYADTIRGFFGLSEGALPRLDLVQLGMGPDGHTASLFPHSAATTAHGIVVMNHAGLAPWVDRLTLTFDAINNAACVLFVAKGADKATMLKDVTEGPQDPCQFPASGVAPVDGELIWLLEPAIAGPLSD